MSGLFGIHGLVRSTEATLSDFIMKDGSYGVLRKPQSSAVADGEGVGEVGRDLVLGEPIVAHSTAASA